MIDTAIVGCEGVDATATPMKVFVDAVVVMAFDTAVLAEFAAAVEAVVMSAVTMIDPAAMLSVIWLAATPVADASCAM